MSKSLHGYKVKFNNFWWVFCWFSEWNPLPLSIEMQLPYPVSRKQHKSESGSWSTSSTVITRIHHMWNPNLRSTGLQICSSRSLLCVLVICSPNMNQSHDLHLLPFVMLAWTRTSFFCGTKMNLWSTGTLHCSALTTKIWLLHWVELRNFILCAFYLTLLLQD